jgi:uncharacterized protein
VSTAENKEIVLKFMHAMGRRDVQALADLATDDLVYQLMGTATISGERDKAGLIELASGLVRVLDGDLVFENVVFTAEDDRVAAAYQGRARLIDGRSYENVYHVLFFVRGGKVCELREFFDTKYADEFIGSLAPTAGGPAAEQ